MSLQALESFVMEMKKDEARIEYAKKGWLTKKLEPSFWPT